MVAAGGVNIGGVHDGFRQGAYCMWLAEGLQVHVQGCLGAVNWCAGTVQVGGNVVVPLFQLIKTRNKLDVTYGIHHVIRRITYN